MVLFRSLSSLVALSALAFLSLSASASPYLRKASSTTTLELANIAAADRARVQALQAGGSSSINATNAVMIYTANVGVGSPPTDYALLVDTGSSYTWIGANKTWTKTNTSQDSGKLSFGGYDASKITGDISYEPITPTYPASTYWGVSQSISYGHTPILNEAAGIVDTGTTLILIATDAFDKYQSATGATLDQNTGLLQISLDQYNQLSSLYFTIGGVAYELTPNGQIWPRSLNSAIGGTTDSIYMVVADSGSTSGSGLDFTNGYCFLERFYSVYDTTNSRVGFATTKYTNATSN
ncbi:aspartic peptidase domain-containing protein [Suillus lakei]|nr:aspartic peptidase domain-containing protein [Suillus lakei]